MGSILSRVSSNNKSTTTTAKEAKMAPVGMTYYEKAQSTFKPPLIANDNAFLGDISSRYVGNLFQLKLSSVMEGN